MENHKGPVEFKGFQQNSDRYTDTTDNDCKNQVKEESGELVDGYLGNVHNLSDSGYQISETSRQTILNILEQIKSLPPLERFLIYIKLNEQISNGGDPLKQPLNPLGSRSEVCRTISWIKTHLEEDPEISLPKQQVYDEYTLYCSKIRMKPLSQADFGKVMKQVYPKVKARRLGTRGNSRYCYSGLRNCTKLKIPKLPALDEDSNAMQLMGIQDEKKPLTQASLATAAWLIVKQWSENQLNACFNSLQALAFFLIINYSVGIGTEAANQISSMTSSEVSEDNEVMKSDQSHRDVQIQLQKKILQKEEAIKDRKRKLQSTRLKSSHKKKSRITSAVEALSEASPSESSASSNTSPIEGKSICDKYQDYNNKPASLPDFNCFQKSVVIEESNPEDNTSVKVSATQADLARQTDLPSPKSIGIKYKTVQPKPLYQLCDNMYNPLIVADNRSQNSEPISDKKTETDEFQTELPLSRERLNSISNVDKDAMDDYLGKNNSQHEEEISKYFSKENDITEAEDTSKISQLRQLLQENDFTKAKISDPEINSSGDVKVSSHNSPVINYQPVDLNVMQNVSGTSGGARRRVSFDVMLQDDSVPCSPNTRRKHFSFTPISPGPLSPTGNGRQSKGSSTNVSPFVSPRNTPVPKGRNFQNSGLTLQILPTRKMSGSTSTKVKKEIDLSPDLVLENETTGQVTQHPKKNFLAMSAPPSPILPNKSMLQTLLNTNGKVSYTPNYINQPLLKQDNKSTEICQVVTNSPVLSLSDDVGFRSQSVPLNQMIEKNTFLLTDNGFLPPLSQDDFNELDTIEDEKLGVTNIINSLNAQVYNNNNVEIISLDDKLIQDNLDKNDILLTNTNFEKPCRNLERSQSIDIISFDQKILSRSVPSTPLPFLQIAQPNEDIVIQNSHSYPSTPLIADDSFNYSLRDCLINGQPIKNDELSQVYNEAFVTFEPLDGDNNIVLESNPDINFLDKTSITSDQNFNIRIN
ncbi:uncharacterized protein LOC123306884 [Coccinella septempunctata]|uniref:uncharacterized protein LOC123306884 n=1 Tax=Coccinella septempunctata TaxID=41139 RepID=UPI001D06D63E|nr:uncharacterized protein LOC123306884 [Coccinella septempunctata]